MKGMIFTTDAIFALVIVGAAISIVVYFNYATQSPYNLAAGQAQSILNFLSTTNVGSISNTSLGAFAQCNPAYGTTVLQAAVQYYLNGSGSCGTYMLDSIYKSSNYGIFINSTYAPAISIAKLNGVSSYINTAKSVSLPAHGTFAAWVSIAAIPSVYPGVVEVAYGTPQLLINNFGTPYIQLCASTCFSSAASQILTVNKWTFIAGVWSYNGVSTTLQEYTNGVAATSATSSESPSGGGPGTVLIGNNGGTVFNGLMTDVQFYNTTLSQSQLSSLYQEGISGAPLGGAGNIGWWLLEGNTYDFSGQNDTGIPTNVIYVTGNYVPLSFANSYSVSRAGTLLPFSKYASAYGSNSIYTSSPKLYAVGVYAWR